MPASSATLPARRTIATALVGVALLVAAVGAAARFEGAPDAAKAPRASEPSAPERLADTGLYEPGTLAVRGENLPYTPQYPLWSDGAKKRRWIHLPAGTRIDASDADAWRFPVGTKFWKEFDFGRPVETRYMERTETGWVFATYAWTADGREARLAPPEGIRRAHDLGGAAFHDLPSRLDCAACHEGRPVPVLGFGALQLSGDRDPNAPHAETPDPRAIDLPGLVARGLLDRPDPRLGDTAPHIAAADARERAALGYLHANCGSCHSATGPLRELGLDLEARLDAPGLARSRALPSALGVAGRYRPPGLATPTPRLAPGDPEHSLIPLRARTRDPLRQMPPFGTRLVDDDAVSLLDAWIREDLAARPSIPPSRRNDP